MAHQGIRAAILKLRKAEMPALRRRLVLPRDTDRVLCWNRITGKAAEADWIGGDVGDNAYRCYQSCYDRLNSS